MSDCVISEHTAHSTGYARIRVNGVLHRHHRWVWEQANGPIPPGMMVLHTCDVRNCINLEHLFLGTAKDNARDMAAKGRHWQQAKTHCLRGHEYTPENTYLYKEEGRRCRACAKERKR